LSGILSAKGDPACPLSEAELLTKFKRLTENRVGERWRDIPETVGVLEDKRASELVDLVTGSRKD
jgi:hypothetical protein